MKGISKLIAGLLIGAMLGLWFGVDIGRERPLFSNPFKKESIHEKFRKAGKGVLDSVGGAIEESAEDFHDKLKD